MTKKDIYEAHGVEYKAGKINAPALGWIAPLLKNGNAKVGEGVYTFSLLPGNAAYTAKGRHTAEALRAAHVDAVRGTCACNCRGCYAQTGFYRFDATVAALMRTTFLSRECTEWVRHAIEAQIEADDVKLVRIHASGDFFSAEYAAMWRRVAKFHPRTLFWTYTKAREYEDLFRGLSNANVVRSIVTAGGRSSLNFGPCGVVADLYEALRDAGEDVYLCPCGVPGIGDSVHCNACAACASHRYALFVEHSTGYDPTADPELDRVIEILRAQG